MCAGVSTDVQSTKGRIALLESGEHSTGEGIGRIGGDRNRLTAIIARSTTA